MHVFHSDSISGVFITINNGEPYLPVPEGDMAAVLSYYYEGPAGIAANWSFEIPVSITPVSATG